MIHISPVKLAAGFLVFIAAGLAQGYHNHDVLAFNEFLYDIGLWDYVN